MITMMGRRKMESLFQWSNMGMHGEFVKLINNDGSVCGLSSELTQKAACIIFRAIDVRDIVLNLKRIQMNMLVFMNARQFSLR